MTLDALIRFYHDLSPQSVARFSEYYSDDAFFKDPFNEVRGVRAIERIFRHMFEQVAEPRFIVSETIGDRHGAVLVWTFHFRAAGWGGGREQLMRGVSHLRFDADGRVNYHRDYWDTAEELYVKLPLVGWLMRGLRRLLKA